MVVPLIALILASGVGSSGSLKYTNVTKSKVKKGFWMVSTTCPKFSDVSNVAHLANKGLAEWCAYETDQWTGQIVKGMDKPEREWYGEYTPKVVLSEPNIVSVEMTEYADLEGAHPNTAQHELSFGMVNGVAKRLVLADLFRSGSNPLPVVSKIVMSSLKAKQASWVIEGTIKALTKLEGDQFLIKRDRLTFVFSPYEMGSYAEGTYEIDVPFKALAGKLNPSGPLKPLLR
jgi:hypothetical protein